MLTALSVVALVLCGSTLQVSGVDPVSTACVLQCDLTFGAVSEVSGCDCNALRAQLVVRTHTHTAHPHHLNHHFTTTPTITTTPTPALRTTTDLCDFLCAIQQGGDACHCLKPGLPGRK
ncbi:uncharacterized protein LOC133191413 [Saccostrea echinata]|uniref:uncharacterized protein LOC133191413 n=1 Tax=Saccostrea echinata TaxID=191078 RepID=UPI002A814D3A|nr:uncharacterized protein LOC133191413 [Saccostrea echinata]XP_061183151.1 uncharacterized protein LOC133191413 [Saccostrea echinata]